MSGRFEKLLFPGSQGGALAARLDLPDGAPSAFALFAHCFTCGKDNIAASRIARGLAERGFAVLRFDFTGLGGSEGDFANTDFSSNIADLVRAADFLRTSHAAPRLLIGHSLGGAAVLAAAEQVPECVAVATIGAPADPEHVTRHLTAALPAIAAAGEAEVEIAGRRFRIRRSFLDDLAAQNMRERVARLGRALLVFHAPLDQIVGIENATAIFTAAHHPKSFVSLDDADHLLTRSEDAGYVAEVLAAWASRYLPDQKAVTAPIEPGLVTVAEADGAAGRLTRRVVAGRHRFWADEPPPFGADQGPTPYDMLLAALGACTSMTVRLYADRKGWPLENISVRLRHARVHVEDCVNCTGADSRLDRIEVELAFTGDLSPEQRNRLGEIAGSCPVHRTLRGRPQILLRQTPSAAVLPPALGESAGPTP